MNSTLLKLAVFFFTVVPCLMYVDVFRYFLMAFNETDFVFICMCLTSFQTSVVLKRQSFIIGMQWKVPGPIDVKLRQSIGNMNETSVLKTSSRQKLCLIMVRIDFAWKWIVDGKVTVYCVPP